MRARLAQETWVPAGTAAHLAKILQLPGSDGLTRRLQLPNTTFQHNPLVLCQGAGCEELPRRQPPPADKSSAKRTLLLAPARPPPPPPPRSHNAAAAAPPVPAAARTSSCAGSGPGRAAEHRRGSGSADASSALTVTSSARSHRCDLLWQGRWAAGAQRSLRTPRVLASQGQWALTHCTKNGEREKKDKLLVCCPEDTRGLRHCQQEWDQWDMRLAPNPLDLSCASSTVLRGNCIPVTNTSRGP